MQPKHVTINNPGLRVRETNALIDRVYNKPNGNTYMQESPAGLSYTEPRNEYSWIDVKAEDTIPPYSIFTIKTGLGKQRSAALAKQKIIDGTEDYELFLTNEYHETFQGVRFQAFFLNTHRPYLINYEGDDPIIGDRLGPIPDTFKISKDYRGLIAVTDADTEDKRVWVIRDFQLPIYIGKTTTNADFPTYPDRPANTFVVALQRSSFTEEPGWQCLELEPLGKDVIAKDVNDAYHEEGDEVVVYKIDDRWYMIGVPESLFTAKLGTDVCGVDDEEASVNTIKRYNDCLELDNTYAKNPYRHAGIVDKKVLLLQSICIEEGAEGECPVPTLKYDIIDIEKRNVCVVNSLRDFETCFKYLPFSAQIEWCQDPEEACTVWEWEKCEPSSGEPEECPLVWELFIGICCLEE